MPITKEKLAAEIAALRARVKVLERALVEIAKQKTGEEMDADAADYADWQIAYGIIVGVARAALRESLEASGYPGNVRVEVRDQES